ncbi:hypothetical protein F5Y03DRAFT_35065 [Xylaria venustula]|nr:hypothetical protein F5Y03DRAFT_35065 [Xylaria venustula]
MPAATLISDELRQRVLFNTGSDRRLKNRALDLDAMAVAIMSKRRQISNISRRAGQWGPIHSRIRIDILFLRVFGNRSFTC